MICYVHCQQEASVEVVEVEVVDLAEVVVEVEVADLAEVEEVVDEEEAEVGFSIIAIFYGRDRLSLIPLTLFNLQYRSKVSWQSLASRSSRRETQLSILETFEDLVPHLKDWVLSFDDQGSSFKFRVKKALSLKVYTYLSF